MAKPKLNPEYENLEYYLEYKKIIIILKWLLLPCILSHRCVNRTVELIFSIISLHKQYLFIYLFFYKFFIFILFSYLVFTIIQNVSSM